MKIIIITLLLSSIFCFNQTNGTNVTEANTTNVTVTYYEEPVYVVDEYYWTSDPVEYVYVTELEPAFDYISYTYEPYYDLYYRRQDSKENPKKEMKKEDIEKQLKSLKKEIFGNETASTDKIRKEKKALNPKWLLAQMKISKVLFLEDEIKKKMKPTEQKNAKVNVTETK